MENRVSTKNSDVRQNVVINKLKKTRTKSNFEIAGTTA